MKNKRKSKRKPGKYILGMLILQILLGMSDTPDIFGWADLQYSFVLVNSRCLDQTYVADKVRVPPPQPPTHPLDV